jgi:hypothetical protein
MHSLFLKHLPAYRGHKNSLHNEVRNDFKVTHCGTLESPWIRIWYRRLLPGLVPLVCTAIDNHFAICGNIFAMCCTLLSPSVFCRHPLSTSGSSSSSYLSTFFAPRLQVCPSSFGKPELPLIAFKACQT